MPSCKWKWKDLMEDGTITRIASTCATQRELRKVLTKHLGSNITKDSLCSAYIRYADQFDLPASLESLLLKRVKVEDEPAPRIQLEDIHFKLPKKRRKALEKAQRYIITSALNNCPVDENLWASIQQYAKINKAQIVVIPSRYKNPTTRQDAPADIDDAWWPSELHPYMTDEFVELHEHLYLMGNVRIQATTVNPLTGLESLSRSASAIYGHSQLSMKMVPTPQCKLPKIQYTTGSVSEPIYSDTKAGIKGLEAHSMGALIVEKDGPRFYIRTAQATPKGTFTDVGRVYHPSGSSKAKRALALILGDTHVGSEDPANQRAIFGPGGLVKSTKPEVLVDHDLFDGRSISHHTRRDPVKQYAAHKGGHHRVLDELEEVVKYLSSTTPKNTERWVVASNHNDHLTRWLKEVHVPTAEPWNTEVWLELWQKIAASVEYKANGTYHQHPLTLWLQDKVPNVRFLDRGEGVTVAGILVDMHGDKGSNGSRGSLNQFSKIGTPSVTGHSHTPGIVKTAWQTGTSSFLKLAYTQGPSSWCHAHVIIHADGTRQMIIVVDGHWRKV